jgi:hypothetical protein
MIEAAILGRPVHSIVTDDFARTQEGTLHFHHLLPENGGFLRIGRGFEHHADLLAASLADEAGARDETQRFVRWFLRPHGIDRDCTPVVVDELERVQAAPPVGADAALGVILARVTSLAVLPVARALMRRRPTDGAARSLVERWRRVRRQGRKRFGQTRKTAATRARQIRKDLQVRLRGFGA